MQNIYKTSKKITIQWLGLVDTNNPDKNIYSTEYYDKTGIESIIKMNLEIPKGPWLQETFFLEFETILTSVELDKLEKKRFRLPKEESDRILRLLKRSVDKETGKLPGASELSEDNPDGRKYSSFLHHHI